ncbi:hypothetical protein FM114_05275 [Luteococcus japonicus LSP_Lj1]|uniref:Uncharacterized protein n=1 Tax=Luteococcus japonicus LSP_Lj1 TaxID=1255658 RepID=A0A1R4J363_9ACTN|nr:hypothetical protein FM114_05275 [Luteococcus japonicus LSP_Lj1]
MHTRHHGASFTRRQHSIGKPNPLVRRRVGPVTLGWRA